MPQVPGQRVENIIHGTVLKTGSSSGTALQSEPSIRPVTVGDRLCISAHYHTIPAGAEAIFALHHQPVLQNVISEKMPRTPETFPVSSLMGDFNVETQDSLP